MLTIIGGIMNLKQNESTTDRIIRVVVGLILVGIGWLVLANSTFGIVLDTLGVILMITGATGICMIYKLFGDFSTKK